ncbi:Riboflavin biosynthesis protein ribBA [Gordonia paraffinivorans]|uniref:Multifunctional fusion protein n=2 Tax=Gordonia paraffinivorans TaxID=175628 RepID=A0ABD7UYC0_9ACTN|nr:Riboflavin biosynthesis protein ribBA [Gordonia paraffinivorans]
MDATTRRVDAAINTLRAGRPVLVADDPGRENEGDLVLAAEHMTTEHMAFFLRHGSGIVCTPMPREHAERLDLPLMVEDNTDNHQTAFTVSVDHRDAGTGISAADRALTVRALADPDISPADFRRPGHMFPLVSRDGGLAERHGHTEASVELTRLAGCGPVAAITELVDDAGLPLSGHRITEFAHRYDLPLITVGDLLTYLARTTSDTPRPPAVRRTGEARLPTAHGDFSMIAYRSDSTGAEHLALVSPGLDALADASAPPLTRIHSECLTGDVLGSLRCDCGGQLEAALSRITDERAGVLLYLRGHEGRGIGLGGKVAAYALQEAGLDTIDANTALGFPVDGRDFSPAAEILTDLGIPAIRLLSNNPAKATAMAAHGIEVTEVLALPPRVTPENIDYLATKRDRLGHTIATRLAAPLRPTLARGLG